MHLKTELFSPFYTEFFLDYRKFEKIYYAIILQASLLQHSYLQKCNQKCFVQKLFYLQKITRHSDTELIEVEESLALKNVQNIGELNKEIPWGPFEEWVGISLYHM